MGGGVAGGGPSGADSSGALNDPAGDGADLGEDRPVSPLRGGLSVLMAISMMARTTLQAYTEAIILRTRLYRGVTEVGLRDKV